MGLFPIVQSPCPYRGPLADILDGTICRLCDREVHDIGALPEAERIALVDGCSDEICVTYKVSMRSTLAAFALGAVATATPAMAQSQLEGAQAAPQPAAFADDIIVGGLRKAREVQWFDDRPAAKRRELPVIVEAPAPAQTARQTEQPKVSTR